MSNASHYPSLELCKKLHSIGMRGEGEYGYAEWQSVNGVGDEHTKTEFTSKESFYNLGKRKAEGGKWMHLSWIFIEAYSVMEMLDVMPDHIAHKEDEGRGWDYVYQLLINKRVIDYGYDVFYGRFVEKPFILHQVPTNTFPNALAEMVLWLHENNYISFNK